MARYNYYHPYSSSYYYEYLMEQLSLPFYVFFFVATLFLFLGFTWYINYESMLEDLADQLKLFLMLTPLFLLLVVHWLSSHDPHRVPFIIPLPDERDSLHRAGGSPWGVALLLMFLIFMISHHSSLQERWFPLLSRR